MDKSCLLQRSTRTVRIFEPESFFLLLTLSRFLASWLRACTDGGVYGANWKRSDGDREACRHVFGSQDAPFATAVRALNRSWAQQPQQFHSSIVLSEPPVAMLPMIHLGLILHYSFLRFAVCLVCSARGGRGKTCALAPTK
jgi:hypothetical protein